MGISELEKKINRLVIGPFLGKTQMQWLFVRLYLLSVKGLGFGYGPMLHLSGEIKVLQYLKNKWKKNTRSLVIFDVGANRGEYTLEVVKNFSDHTQGVKIFSFEPSLEIFLDLSKNISENPDVVLENLGFSDREEVRPLFVNSQFNATSSLHEGCLRDFGLAVDKTEQVQLATIEGYCRKHQIQHIDLLKIDVEGHELAVLMGAGSMLRKREISAIQFEIGRTSIESRTFLKDFFDLLSPDYRIYRILRNGLFEIVNYDVLDEVFLTTNYLAEIKE